LFEADQMLEREIAVRSGLSFGKTLAQMRVPFP